MRLSAYELGNTVLAFVAERCIQESGIFWWFLDDRYVKVNLAESTRFRSPLTVEDSEGTLYAADVDVGDIVDKALLEQGTWGFTTTSPAIYQHLVRKGTFEGPKGARIYRRDERTYPVLFR